MKPAYKVGQRIKVIPHFNEIHAEYPSGTYDVWDTGVIEDMEKYGEEDLDCYVYDVRFDGNPSIRYVFESMMIPEDYEYTTDNFITNPKVKRVIGRSATTLLCVCEVNGLDYVFEHTFVDY